MEVSVRVTQGGDDLAALHHWLDNERELRGGIRRPPAPGDPTALGSVPDYLTVTITTVEAARILSRSLITWMRTRRTTAQVSVETTGRRVTLDIEGADGVMELLEQILRADD